VNLLPADAHVQIYTQHTFISGYLLYFPPSVLCLNETCVFVLRVHALRSYISTRMPTTTLLSLGTWTADWSMLESLRKLELTPVGPNFLPPNGKLLPQNLSELYLVNWSKCHVYSAIKGIVPCDHITFIGKSKSHPVPLLGTLALIGATQT
jgi:hypothetical protein